MKFFFILAFLLAVWRNLSDKVMTTMSKILMVICIIDKGLTKFLI